ncbi:MAG TPA: hypothetical protein VFM99_01685 [Chitinophagales bacterium]|nr:hypothetical protein [Chitinophagales bacterium]
MRFLNQSIVLFFLITLLFFIGACKKSTSTPTTDTSLQMKVDSLEMKLDKLKEQVAPGLGELMNINHIYIQKLEKDIETENWEYADFHLHEMEEIFERMEELHNHHDELVQPADEQFKAFIFPTFNKLENAVDEKNKTLAEVEYVNLKAGCNNCHKANNKPFIVIE